jgi:cell division septation protein DedD
MHEGGEHIPASSWGKRLGWGAVISLLIVWSFVLGILVGQGSILPPEDLQYVQDFLGLSGQPEVQAENDPVTKETEMSFYQGIKDGAPAAQKLKSKPKAADRAKAAAEKDPAPQPATPPAGDQAQEPAAASPQDKGWVIQVASLKAQDMALKMVRRLKSGGLPAYVLRSQVKNLGLRYRVRVGPYDSRQSAGQTAARIKSKFNHPALIMREE